MRDYQIISDSSCDLAPELANEKGIDIIPFYVSFDETTYQKEREELSVEDFYQKVLDNPKVFPKTSLPPVGDFADRFRYHIERGLDVLCICISTKFSGSYNSACTARDLVLEEYPDANIIVINSIVNTCLQGLVVLEAARMKEDGYELEEVARRLDDIKNSGRIFFTIGSIDYLAHGGRIGKLAGLAVSTLGLKPLILEKEGEIFSEGICRTRKKSLLKVKSLTKEYFTKAKEDPATYTITIGYGHDLAEAEAFRDELIAELDCGLTKDDIPIRRIGATIAVHTGPEALGVCVLRRYDVPQPQTEGMLASILNKEPKRAPKTI